MANLFERFLCSASLLALMHVPALLPADIDQPAGETLAAPTNPFAADPTFSEPLLDGYQVAALLGGEADAKPALKSTPADAPSTSTIYAISLASCGDKPAASEKAHELAEHGFVQLEILQIGDRFHVVIGDVFARSEDAAIELDALREVGVPAEAGVVRRLAAAPAPAAQEPVAIASR